MLLSEDMRWYQTRLGIGHLINTLRGFTGACPVSYSRLLDEK